MRKIQYLLIIFLIFSFHCLVIVKAEEWTPPSKLTNLGFCTNPSISGDGSKIAFGAYVDGVSEIFVVNSDGTGLNQITHNTVWDSDPCISGDGSKIAFRSAVDGDGDIYVVNSDGSGLKRLTYDQSGDTTPSISYDGSKIAYYSFRYGVNGNYEIYSINSDGSGFTQLTNNTEYDLGPSICDDGSKVSFYGWDGNDWEIFIVNSDGSDLTQLTYRDNTADWYSAISGDGSKIAFISYAGYNDEQIFVINSDGSGLTQLTQNMSVEFPSISGDGSKIAFGAYVDGVSEIFVVNSDGTGLTSITDGISTGYPPSISSDGQKIVFSSEGDIYISRQQVSPVASFSISPTNPKIGDTIEFDASNSYDSDGSITSYIWDFGDGDNANGVKVNHAYSTSETFTINLTVVDSDNLCDTITQEVTIDPTLSVSIEPQSLTRGIGLTGTFTASASGGTPSYSYQWYEGTERMPGQTQSTLSISKNEDGSYSFFCEVTDSTGKTASSLPVTAVYTHDLAAYISPVNYECQLNEHVTINVTASGGLPPYEYQWYEGTSAVSDETSPQLEIVKNEVGVFTFYCQVKDAEGTTINSNQATLNVASTPPLKAITEVNNQVPIVGELVVFTVEPSGGVPPYSYQWYEDGTKLLIDETSATLVVSSNSTSDSLKFSCKVTDSRFESVFSNQITLSVLPKPSPTGISIEVIALIVVSMASLIVVVFWYNKVRKIKMLISEGIKYFRIGNYEKAILCFEKVLDKNPKKIEALTGKGDSLFNLGRYEEAMGFFDKSLKLKQNDPRFWVKKGGCLIGLKEYDDAIDVFDKAIEIDPHDPNLWYDKGLCAYYSNNYQGAIDYFNEALKIEPNHEHALRAIELAKDNL